MSGWPITGKSTVIKFIGCAHDNGKLLCIGSMVTAGFFMKNQHIIQPCTFLLTGHLRKFLKRDWYNLEAIMQCQNYDHRLSINDVPENYLPRITEPFTSAWKVIWTIWRFFIILVGYFQHLIPIGNRPIYWEGGYYYMLFDYSEKFMK